MARPEKNNVEYFPFICKEGRAVFYIEQQYQNDGYATWVKILRQLAVTDYHFINLSDDLDLMFLASKCRISEQMLTNIINDLSKLGEIDKYLWEECRVVYSLKFIENIEDAYLKRKNKLLTYEGLKEYNSIKDNTIKKAAEKPVDYFPNDISLNEKYLEFLKFRKEIGKTLKDVSIKAHIKKLNNLSNNDSDLAIQILDNSIANGYVGIFAINNNKTNNYGKPSINKFGATTIPEGYDPDVF